MLAYPWFAALQNFDESIWRKALNAHDILLARLNELGSTAVISTRPIQDGHYRLNQAFCWSNCVYRPIREKYYLPNEEGFYGQSGSTEENGIYNLPNWRSRYWSSHMQ